MAIWTYKLDQKDGPSKTFYNNGKLQWELVFKNALLQGECKKYDPEGKLIVEGMYKNNLYNGLIREHQFDGKLKSECNYAKENQPFDTRYLFLPRFEGWCRRYGNIPKPCSHAA